MTLYTCNTMNASTMELERNGDEISTILPGVTLSEATSETHDILRTAGIFGGCIIALITLMFLIYKTCWRKKKCNTSHAEVQVNGDLYIPAPESSDGRVTWATWV